MVDGTKMNSTKAGPAESRRERQRRELTAEIIAIARRQLTDGGRAGVSWRAIAREVGMNPASLYTYFESLDELFTAMILESYSGLAGALETALDRALHTATAPADGDEGSASGSGRTEPTIEPLLAVVRAYRQWAVEHPAHYNLIFTDQIPGYAAPPGGPTVEAELAVLRSLISAFGLAVRGEPYGVEDYDKAPPDDVARSLQAWGVLHGLVSLEINHHLPFVEEPERLVIDAAIRSATGTDRFGEEFSG